MYYCKNCGNKTNFKSTVTRKESYIHYNRYDVNIDEEGEEVEDSEVFIACDDTEYDSYEDTVDDGEVICQHCDEVPCWIEEKLWHQLESEEVSKNNVILDRAEMIERENNQQEFISRHKVQKLRDEMIKVDKDGIHTSG